MWRPGAVKSLSAETMRRASGARTVPAGKVNLVRMAGSSVRVNPLRSTGAAEELRISMTSGKVDPLAWAAALEARISLRMAPVRGWVREEVAGGAAGMTAGAADDIEEM